MARLKDTIIEGNARVTGSLYTPSAMLTDLEVVNNLTIDGDVNVGNNVNVDGNINIDGYINDYFVIKTTDDEIMINDYSIFFIAFCELNDSANKAHAQQFNCGELYFKRNNSLKSSVHLHVEMADKYHAANSCWCFTYGTARLNPLLKNGNYTPKGTIDYYPCTLSMSETSPWYGGILFSSKNKFQKIQFSGFSGGFQPFGIQLGYYGSDLTAPNNTWLNPGTGEYDAPTCPYIINFDNVVINDSNVIDMSQADMILSKLYMKDRLRMNEGEPINQRLITTAAACQAAKKSGSNYVPALWKFDANATAIDGDIITIKIPLAPHTYGNYLSIDNGENYYPIVVYNKERLNTQYPVDTYLQLVFEENGSVNDIFPIEGSTARSSPSNCGVWRVINYYDSNTTPYGIRVYKQTTGYNNDYPLLVSRSLGSAIGTNNTNDSYTNNIYGIIWNDQTKVPTLNPSTGLMKVPGGITANLTGNASKATLAQKVGHGQVTNTAIGSFDLAMGQMTAITANQDNTTLPATSNNANAEIIIKAYNTSTDNTNYHEARLGFNSNHSLYFRPVNTSYWRKVITTGDGVNTAVGSLQQPIYVDEDGIVQTTRKMFHMEYGDNGDYVLTSNDSLDNLTGGVYVSRSSSSSGAIDSMPITGSGAVIVNFGGFTQDHSHDRYRRQFVFGNNPNIYYRYQANDTWQDWHKLVQAPTSGSAGSDKKPIYVNSNGCLVTAVADKKILVNLASTTRVNIYDSSGDINLGVTGKLPIANGGTGADTAQGAVQALGIGGIYYVYGTQTASTNAWTGNLTTVTELYSGLTIAYYLPYDGTSTSATLNLTLANNQTTGAKPVYYSTNTRFTTHLAANSIIVLTWVPDTSDTGGSWRKDASIPSGGTAGQTLIKNSNNDGDVSWGTIDVSDKVSKSGDTMTGHLILQGAPGGIPAIRCTFPFLTRGVAPSQTYYSTHVWLDSNNNRLAQIEYTKATNASNFNFGLLADTTDGNHWGGLLVTAALNNSNANWVTLNANAGTITGAVWNDYAEMRAVPLPKNIKPGSCVYEMGDDTMAPTYKRLQKGCKIVSDTFGFNIGETDTAKTPIAVAGRALVYLFEGREAARNAIGEFVCSGPNGTVSIMTTEEYLQNPQAVVGTISAVPDYEEWGSTNVKVNGRIWIYVK